MVIKVWRFKAPTRFTLDLDHIYPFKTIHFEGHLHKISIKLAINIAWNLEIHLINVLFLLLGLFVYQTLLWVTMWSVFQSAIWTHAPVWECRRNTRKRFSVTFPRFWPGLRSDHTHLFESVVRSVHELAGSVFQLPFPGFDLVRDLTTPTCLRVSLALSLS